MAVNNLFDPDCSRCPRLHAHLQRVRSDYPQYYARPVPAFGATKPRLLIVGLAPGMHGANATGRPFTGDYAGILLYETLHKYGFASAAQSSAANDGLKLIDCRITNAVKCLPPENKPTTQEITTCNDFLRAELTALPGDLLIIALGTIAHKAVLRALDLKQSAFAFAHGAKHVLPGGQRLLDSYHCSRYNTQTRRLTPAMFHKIFKDARNMLG